MPENHKEFVFRRDVPKTGFRNSILLLLLCVMVMRSDDVTPENNCFVASNPCQVKEMKSRLESAMDFTKQVIETFNGMETTKCTTQPEDCEAIYNCGFKASGVYTVWPKSRVLTAPSAQVYCDMITESGGWTVIQRRGDFGRAQDYFFNDWNSYKEGFGDILQDFWLGNDLIYAFTNQKLYSLRFDLKDLEGQTRWAMYDKFWIDSEEYNYMLHVRGYTGDAGDSFLGHNGKSFSTKDRDNDEYEEGSSATKYKGAWWYSRGHTSNLNGFYIQGSYAPSADGIVWKSWRGYNYSLPFTEMKIRPLFYKSLRQEQFGNEVPQ